MAGFCKFATGCYSEPKKVETVQKSASPVDNSIFDSVFPGPANKAKTQPKPKPLTPLTRSLLSVLARNTQASVVAKSVDLSKSADAPANAAEEAEGLQLLRQIANSLKTDAEKDRDRADLIGDILCPWAVR
jgi:hypothetical protein